MAYFLRFDGVNDHCLLTTPTPFHQNLTEYRLEAKLTINNAASNITLVGRTDGFDSYITLRTDGFVRIRYGSTNVSLPYTRPAANVPFVLEIIRSSAGGHKAGIDGVFGSEIFNTSTSSKPVQAIGRGSGSVSGAPMDLYYLRLYDATTGGTLLFDWDANASGGMGSALPESVSSNDAILTSFPTDDSQWVFYGGGVSTVGLVTGNGSLTTTVTYDKHLDALLTENGLLQVVLHPDKPITASTTGNGSLTSTPLPDKPITGSITQNGNVEAVITSSKVLTAQVEGGGQLLISPNYSKIVQGILSANGTLAVVLDGAILTSGTVSGGGNLLVQAAIDKVLSASAQGSGSLNTIIEVNKLLASSTITGNGSLVVNVGTAISTIGSVTGNGDLLVQVIPSKEIPGLISGNGITEVVIQKGISLAQFITGNGLLQASVTAFGGIVAVVSGAGTLVVSLEKSIALIDQVSGNGSLSITSIIVNKELQTLNVTANGQLVAVSLGDFSDTNIIAIDLSVIAELTTRSKDVIAEITSKELTRYV